MDPGRAPEGDHRDDQDQRVQERSSAEPKRGVSKPTVCMCIYIYIYCIIYIYIYMLPKRPSIFYHGMQTTVPNKKAYFCIRIVEEYDTPNLPTNIVDFRGFDSSIILI